MKMTLERHIKLSMNKYQKNSYNKQMAFSYMNGDKCLAVKCGICGADVELSEYEIAEITMCGKTLGDKYCDRCKNAILKMRAENEI